MRAQGDEQPTAPQAREYQAEGLGGGDDPAGVGSMHRCVPPLPGNHLEDAHRAGVVEGEQHDARRQCQPTGGVRERTAEPAVAVVEDDQRLDGGAQADMLRKSGVTSASMAPW